MTGSENTIASEQDWEEFWDNLWPVWRRALGGTDTSTPPPSGPILRRRRLTTDFEWVGSFEPMRYLPAVTQALLWNDNGMDLNPLAGRHWELLQLGGPGMLEIGQLSGTPIDHLILTVVDVEDIARMQEIPGLKSLTLAHGDFGELPPLAHLTDLTVYTEVTVDITRNPDLHVTWQDAMYTPPFGPADA